MKKKIALQISAVVLAMGICFLLGWRVMPRIWPTIKEHVVYAILPDLRPEPPAPYEPEPYVPASNTAVGDEIAVSDSVIYYFYKSYCPYCAQLEPLISALPETVTLPDGTKSAVRLIAVNKADETGEALIASYYEQYEIPEEEQYVPAVLIGDQYLFPGIEIIDGLLDALLAGEGLATPLIDGTERIQKN